MFESRLPQRVTRFAAECPQLQKEYGRYGCALRRHFDPTRP
jgi:homogentisate 1,2-dioxygenase